MSQNHAPQQVAGHLAVVAGGAAGLGEVLLMYPLDTVKTRRMLAIDRSNVGVVETMRQIVRTGGVRALYRGILPPICMEAPKRAVKFAVNDTVNPILLSVTGAPSTTQLVSILAGASGGAAESFIVAPFEKVKIRMQDARGLGKYTSSADCFKKTLMHEGPLTFFKGLEATIWCQAIWSAGYFGVIYRIRSLMPVPESRTQKAGTDLLAGFMGGLFGTMLNTPFDVTKSRVQSMELTRGGTLPNNFRVMADIARREGLGAWYKGFKPKAMRLAPGGGILLAFFEQAKMWF